MSEFHDQVPPAALEHLRGVPARLRPVRGRPRSDAPKQRITIRLSPDVLAKFKAAGKGWQTRVDLALRDWLKTHRVR